MRITAILLAALLALCSIPAPPLGAAGTPRFDTVAVITATPYGDVEALSDALQEHSRDVDVVKIDAGELVLSPGSLHGGVDAIVAVGAGAIPVRRWLAASNASPEVVFVGAPHRGSVGAEVVFTVVFATEVEDYRGATGKTRNTDDPDWAFPGDMEGLDYVVTRTHELFEPLYHRYLLESGMSLAPESSGDYLGWLSRRYPARLGDRFSDSRPVGSSAGEGCPFSGLPRGYLDYVAARTAARTYFTLARPGQVITEGILDDVPVGYDLRSMLVDFLRRRAAKFLGEYALPQAARKARESGLAWLEARLDMSPPILAAQLPSSVRIPWDGDGLGIPVNPSIEEVPTPASKVSSVVVEAPNWWQLVRPGTGPNDWWTEADSAVYPGGERRDVYLATGGSLGQRKEVAAEVLAALGLEHPGDHGGGVGNILARGLDSLLGLISSLRPGVARESSGGSEDAPDLPSITAIYRNKSTTLREDRRRVHHRWIWDVDGEELVDDDPENTGGERVFDAGDNPREVSATSVDGEGEVLRRQEWVSEKEEGETFEYSTAEEIVPVIDLEGPRAWMTGRTARYALDARVEDLPDEVENLRMEYYPGREFEVTWERPGRFEVRGAVNLRYSWRFADGSSRYFSVTYSETVDVEVYATGFEAR